MRINSKGQVTIPAPIREKFGLHEGDEVDVVDDGGVLRIVRSEGSRTRGQRMVDRLRGSGNARETAGMSTEQLMELLRG
ncbi:MAG: AbrB/MazE/SpoVT family DNA-binding domain-containing protein [Nocardiopsaceae bacterium]|nr:AbrB/MazE/SpoVT family DNA-binding domain-containing protein [Nocardiopsaceae bacterium]